MKNFNWKGGLLQIPPTILSKITNIQKCRRLTWTWTWYGVRMCVCVGGDLVILTGIVLRRVQSFKRWPRCSASFFLRWDELQSRFIMRDGKRAAYLSTDGHWQHLRIKSKLATHANVPIRLYWLVPLPTSSSRVTPSIFLSIKEDTCGSFRLFINGSSGFY